MNEPRSDPALQDLYADAAAHCYGCGRLNPHGHRLRSYWLGQEAEARLVPPAEQLSLPGFVYGGLIASLIDCHAMATAAADAAVRAGGDPRRDRLPRFVTGTLQVRFQKPTPSGVELVLRGRVREAGERKTIVEVTVTAGDAVTAIGEVIAFRQPESMGG